MAEKPKKPVPTKKAPRKTRVEPPTPKRGNQNKKLIPEPVAAETVIVQEPVGSLSQENERIRLTKEQQCWIVIALGRMVTPVDIRKEVKELWGLEVSPQLLTSYDPTTRSGSWIKEDLKALFREARQEHLASLRQIGTADQTVRLAYLDGIFKKQLASGNLIAARDTLKQIAEEAGGKFTNTQTVNLKGGARQSLANVLGISVDELPEKPRARNH